MPIYENGTVGLKAAALFTLGYLDLWELKYQQFSINLTPSLTDGRMEVETKQCRQSFLTFYRQNN